MECMFVILDYQSIVQFARSLIVFILCMGVIGYSSFMIGYLIAEKASRRKRKKSQRSCAGIDEYR